MFTSIAQYHLLYIFSLKYILLFRTSSSSPLEVYPFALQNNNVFSVDDSCRAISIPDVEPSDLGPNSNLSMVAGEFLEVYGMHHP